MFNGRFRSGRRGDKYNWFKGWLKVYLILWILVEGELEIEELKVGFIFFLMVKDFLLIEIKRLVSKRIRIWN